MKIDTGQKFPENEKEGLDERRQRILHSSVKKTIESVSKQKEKEKKDQKKLENRYIQQFETRYHKALESTDFAMQVISYLTGMEMKVSACVTVIQASASRVPYPDYTVVILHFRIN